MARRDEILDVTVPMREGMPQWDGEEIYRTEPLSRTPADGVNVTKLTVGTHTGTHVDAPWHFLDDGIKLDEIPLSRWIGPALVVDFTHLEGDITAADLEALDVPAGTSKLIFKTRNSELWTTHADSFTSDYVALAPDGAQWVVERGINLVGIDYLSIGSVNDDGRECHLILLGNDVIVVEGLDLSEVEPGQYELLCFPLNVAGADGAPARVALRPLS